MTNQLQNLVLGSLIQVYDNNGIPVLCEFVRLHRFSEAFDFVALDDNITYTATLDRLAYIMQVAG